MTEVPNPIHGEFWIRPQSEIEADLAWLRANEPLTFLPEEEVPEEIDLPEGPGSWVVTRHADILEMSKSPQIYSSARGITVRDNPPEFNEYFGSMINMDDPRHARLRKLVSAGFTPRMLKRLEGSVQETAPRIVDDVAERGEVDFVVDVAAALPLKIVCDLMGIPESHYTYVFDQSNIILGAGDPEYVAELGDIVPAILGAGVGLAELMNDIAEQKAGGDGDDLTSVLVNAEVDGDKLAPSEIASFFILLVVAGNETTRNAISWGLHYLSEHPDQRRIWTDDIEGVGPRAVEEIVRLASPVTYMRRTATRDTVLRDTEIAEGDKLCMFYLAANHDEEVVDDPYRFDVQRDPNPHIGFGGPGPHYCLGAHLARREIMVMFRELFRRLPDIEATDDPVVLRSPFIHGVKHLTARFTPGAPPGCMMRVGFIGLGNVGGKLAGSLLRNSFDLTVRDLDETAAKPFLDDGAGWADSPAAMAQGCDLVITCLPSPAASAAVMEADDGLLRGLGPGKVWAEMSTTDEAEVRRLGALVAESGADPVDCPVSGGCHRAATGNISIFAGCERDVFDRMLPVLTAMGRRILHTGPLGSASVLKVVTNYLASANLVSLTEALTTAKAAGMDLNTTYEAIRISSGNSFVHETESQVILNGSRDISFTMDLVVKDMSLFQAVADRAGVPLELSPLLLDIFRDGEARYGPREWSPNIVRRLEDATGLDVGAPGFPAEMIDDEPEEPGREVVPRS